MSPRWAVFVLAGVVLGACGPVIPKELVNARGAYKEIQNSQASTTVPEAVEEARNALARAERSFQDEGASDQTRALATEAERRAEAAQQICAQRAFTTPPPIAERIEEPKVNAEARIREVLTAVPGTVMFEFDKAELREEAKERLDQLAEALDTAKAEGQMQTIVVEGHADAKGPEKYNQDLSERRARAVKEYLTSRGYDPSFVQVRAMGEDAPFGDNQTAEGRANNRRVEIRLGEKKSGD